jgi:hypothetical protein
VAAVAQAADDVGGDVGVGPGLVLQVQDPGILPEQRPEPGMAVLPGRQGPPVGAVAAPHQDPGAGLGQPPQHGPDARPVGRLVQRVHHQGRSPPAFADGLLEPGGIGRPVRGGLQVKAAGKLAGALGQGGTLGVDHGIHDPLWGELQVGQLLQHAGGQGAGTRLRVGERHQPADDGGLAGTRRAGEDGQAALVRLQPPDQPADDAAAAGEVPAGLAGLDPPGGQGQRTGDTAALDVHRRLRPPEPRVGQEAVADPGGERLGKLPSVTELALHGGHQRLSQLGHPDQLVLVGPGPQGRVGAGQDADQGAAEDALTGLLPGVGGGHEGHATLLARQRGPVGEDLQDVFGHVRGGGRGVAGVQDDQDLLGRRLGHGIAEAPGGYRVPAVHPGRGRVPGDQVVGTVAGAVADPVQQQAVAGRAGGQPRLQGPLDLAL